MQRAKTTPQSRPFGARQLPFQGSLTTRLFFSPPLEGEVVRVSEPEGFSQTSGLTQADLSGGLRRPVGRLRAKEVRGTSAAQPDDTAYGRRQAVGVVNTVRELLGHADLKMTLQYAHLAPEAKARAVEALDVTLTVPTH